MNENRRIDSPRIRIVQCVDALKMKTCVESLQKQTMGLICNIQNSQLLNCSSNFLRYTGKIGLWQILQLIFACVKIVAKQLRFRMHSLKLESEISPLQKCFNVQMGTKKRLGKPYNMDEFQISWRNNSFHPLLLFPFTARKF